MKKLSHIFLFVLAFQVEVRVRASDTVSFPEHCLGRSFPCSFKVTEDKWTYETGNIKLHASAETLLTEVQKSKEWKLVEGTLWVQNAPSAKIKTVFADAEGSSGQYWVFARKDKVVFRNISSKLTVTFKDQSKMEIPRGFEVWAGPVNTEAQTEHGMIEPIHLKSHLKAWYELYPGPRTQFVSEVQDLKDQWSDLVEESGDVYKKVVERKMAALDDEKRKELEVKKKKEQERQRIREEFHHRVFEK
jgi:hypothetical protein